MNIMEMASHEGDRFCGPEMDRLDLVKMLLKLAESHYPQRNKSCTNVCCEATQRGRSHENWKALKPENIIPVEGKHHGEELFYCRRDRCASQNRQHHEKTLK